MLAVLGKQPRCKPLFPSRSSKLVSSQPTFPLQPSSSVSLAATQPCSSSPCLNTYQVSSTWQIMAAANVFPHTFKEWFPTTTLESPCFCKMDAFALLLVCFMLPFSFFLLLFIFPCGISLQWSLSNLPDAFKNKTNALIWHKTNLESPKQQVLVPFLATNTLIIFLEHHYHRRGEFFCLFPEWLWLNL